MFISCNIWYSRMTSSNENIFRVTGPLCGEFTGRRWILLARASNAEHWFFFICAFNKRITKQSWRRWNETPSCSLWRHCNDKSTLGWHENGHPLKGVLSYRVADKKIRDPFTYRIWAWIRNYLYLKQCLITHPCHNFWTAIEVSAWISITFRRKIYMDVITYPWPKPRETIWVKVGPVVSYATFSPYGNTFREPLANGTSRPFH